MAQIGNHFHFFDKIGDFFLPQACLVPILLNCHILAKPDTLIHLAVALELSKKSTYALSDQMTRFKFFSIN